MANDEAGEMVMQVPTSVKTHILVADNLLAPATPCIVILEEAKLET